MNGVVPQLSLQNKVRYLCSGTSVSLGNPNVLWMKKQCQGKKNNSLASSQEDCPGENRPQCQGGYINEVAFENTVEYYLKRLAWRG